MAKVCASLNCSVLLERCAEHSHQLQENTARTGGRMCLLHVGPFEHMRWYRWRMRDLSVAISTLSWEPGGPGQVPRLLELCILYL